MIIKIYLDILINLKNMKKYITNNKKKFVKTFLTTTSFLVVAVSNHDVMAGAAAAARETSSNKTQGKFSTGGGLDHVGAFVTESTLQFTNPKNANVDIADVNILAIDVHGKDLSANSSQYHKMRQLVQLLI
jgi:hypothetical protein